MILIKQQKSRVVLISLLSILALGFWLSGCANFASYLSDSVVSPYKEAPYIGAIPKRGDQAMSGSEFVRRTSGLTLDQRENAILHEIRRGNIPNYLRRLKPVTIRWRDGAQADHRAIIWVMPDYLSIGSDGDFVRMPMNPITAQRIADHYGFVLPTRKMVDLIYENSSLKLTPQPLPAGPQMTSMQYIVQHNKQIETQLDNMAFSYQNSLIAGHKKDVIITNRLLQMPQRVAIYGWHKAYDTPIQPVSLVHNNHYADYSHGIRLVAGTMLLDGLETPILELLENEKLVAMLSDEGIMRVTRVATNNF